MADSKLKDMKRKYAQIHSQEFFLYICILLGHSYFYFLERKLVHVFRFGSVHSDTKKLRLDDSRFNLTCFECRRKGHCLCKSDSVIHSFSWISELNRCFWS